MGLSGKAKLVEEAMVLEVRNRLKRERRDVSLYHHGQRTSHIISYGNSLRLELKPAEAGDHLNISVVIGPGPSPYEYLLDFPGFCDYRFCGIGSFVCTRIGQHIHLTPPVLDVSWQLRLAVKRMQMRQNDKSGRYVVIRDTERLPVSTGVFPSEKIQSQNPGEEWYRFQGRLAA